MENFDQMIFRRRSIFKGGFGCGIGTAVLNPVYTNSIQNYQFVISWILKGEGKYTEDGRVYTLRDACVCMRRPDRDYRMELEPESGIRIYLSLSHEIYSALSYLIPELSSLPPVWDLPYNESYYEEFLAIYDRIAELSSLELYHSLPAIIHYILRITGIENSRAHDPILRARLLLEENTALSAEQIAEQCGINYNTFRKQFKKSFGLSPVQYRIQHRIAVAKQLLAEGLPVGEIATSLGYPDIYTFTHQFTTITNQSPTDFRRRIEPQKPTSTSKQPRKQRI